MVVAHGLGTSVHECLYGAVFVAWMVVTVYPVTVAYSDHHCPRSPVDEMFNFKLHKTGSVVDTLAALSEATSANPLRTSHGATSPEAGSSPLSSSSMSEELADVTLEDEGAILFEPDTLPDCLCGFWSS